MEDQQVPITRYCCILPHPSLSALLLLQSDTGWEFPAFELPTGWFPIQVNAFVRMVQHQLGIRAMVLRQFHENGTLYVEMENLDSQEIPILYGCWAERADVSDLTFLVPDQKQMAMAWFQTAEVVKVSAFPASWEQQGWFTKVFSWIALQLARLKYTAAGPIEQIKGAWTYSCVLRVPTTMEDLYFKAVHPTYPTEDQVITILAKHWAENVPTLVAVDTSRHWMLMRDFAGKSLEDASLHSWEGAVHHFAVMQRDSVADLSLWFDSGCPDFRPDALIALIDQLQTDAFALQITSQEFQDLQTFAPRLKEQCQRLTMYRVPSVLLHPDFRAGNVVVKQQAYLYFDWSDTIIAHPFFALVRFLDLAEISLMAHRGLSSQEVVAVMSNLSDTYLQSWIMYEPIDRLYELLHLTTQLNPLLQTLRVYRHLPYLLTPSLYPANTAPSMIRLILERMKASSL